jgi:hypothetical protein
MAASNTLSSSVVFAKEAEMARLEQEYAFLARELEKETDKDARANIEMDQQLVIHYFAASRGSSVEAAKDHLDVEAELRS